VNSLWDLLVCTCRHCGADQNGKAVEAEFVIDAELPAEIGAVEGDRRFGEADGLADGGGGEAFTDLGRKP